jgi:hypothetical protein
MHEVKNFSHFVILGYEYRNNIKDSVAQWIRRWSTEPEILVRERIFIHICAY